MKKRLLVVLVAALVIAVPVVAFAGHFATGQANLHSENESGITATINFADDGSTLTVNGTATGLTPSVLYASLIYDRASVPSGPLACEPILPPGHRFDIEPTMFLGFWTNNDDGTGTLVAVNTNGGSDYVPLDDFKTVSVRNASSGFALAACGLVVRSP